jgi:hypothetical protein
MRLRSRAARLVALGLISASVGIGVGVGVADAFSTARTYFAEYTGGSDVYECGVVSTSIVDAGGHQVFTTAGSAGYRGAYCLGGPTTVFLTAQGQIMTPAGLCAGPMKTATVYTSYIGANLQAGCGPGVNHYELGVAWILDNIWHGAFSADSNGGLPEISGPVAP